MKPNAPLDDPAAALRVPPTRAARERARTAMAWIRALASQWQEGQDWVESERAAPGRDPQS